MSRIQANIVTIFGCAISLASFCLLPYLVVPSTSFAFTGLQLVFLGSQIPLPHYYVIQTQTQTIPGMLQNDPYVGVVMILFALMIVFAVASVWSRQRWDARVAWGVIAGVGITFSFSLCSFVRNVTAGLGFMNAHANTLSGTVHGSLFTPGFLGVLLGLAVAFIGSVITLRIKS